SEADFTLIVDYARQLGRRDLAVIAGQAAEAGGFANGQTFREPAFPLIPTPVGANWTVVHAIARQESQFSQNAQSRTGALGLMQLMPATAADQSRKLGLPYSPGGLTADPLYNMTVGDAYFQRLLTSFDGSYPLAIAAYNAGPGNVRKWLAANGDPRTGAVEWVEWIERIPYSETRNYVAHVMENMVTYEAMHPERAQWHGPDAMSHYLGKQTPG
ncbi:MAG TPA: transglycosylase SLT domain-containing protein, partial [Novosphingobium sp.]|nr:transglycosylase SLT domain-containing protein [Novosphingobium sp.]